MQRIGDRDTAELTVYVAGDPAEWKQHYVEYLQLMDEPNNLGAQNCWILQPHLSLIQATIRRQGAGASLVIDFQTKKYAAAMKAKAAPPRPAATGTDPPRRRTGAAPEPVGPGLAEIGAPRWLRLRSGCATLVGHETPAPSRPPAAPVPAAAARRRPGS